MHTVSCSRSSFLGGLVLALVVLALAGCGGSDDGGAGSGSSESGSGQPGYVAWPYFGRVPERTHYLPSHERVLDPPLRQAWSINTHALIEFPPAIANGVAYVINKYGNGKAVRLSDRKVLWELKLRPNDKGTPLDVTAPVYYDGRVYGAFLDGYVAAGDAATGRKVWVRKLDAHLESSPLPIGGLLYFGTDTTDVLALRTSDGTTSWKFNVPGAVKASPSFHDGNVFVADYEGSMFALEADSGKPVWRTNTTTQPPFGRGGFFSSPAIAFGNVYAARDDGTVFAFDAKTGKLRWSYDVGGPIPGTATVIGHTVYTSSFETNKTIGIDARTHKKTFELDQAGYTPVVSDGRRLFLVGYFDLIGLEPTKP